MTREQKLNMQTTRPFDYEDYRPEQKLTAFERDLLRRIEVLEKIVKTAKL